VSAAPQHRTTVLVNLLWLVPGVVGGSEESVTDALRAVAAADPTDLELRLAVLAPFAEAHPDLAEAFPTVVSELDGSDKARRVFAEQTWLARESRRWGADVVHHAGGTVPFVHPGAVVLTIQDLQPLDMPQNFSVVKRTYLRLMLGRSARSAVVVVVPSEFTRQRVVELLGVPSERVRVVPWAPRPAPDPVGRSNADANPESVPDGPFLLYPAITYPHKNHLTLLDAFARLEGPAAHARLVLTGGSASMEPRVLERIDELGLGDRVLRTGRVDQARLEALYAAATAVVVPSRYEGFGLPALEAMARECPVVVARSGSLPEVARPEDLVDADDVTAWAAAMQSVLTLTDRARTDRVGAGRRVVERFSPERTAAGLIEAYRAARPLP
jgi:alpha-1,3-rhamnosyl/mannosyltransferase